MITDSERASKILNRPFSKAKKTFMKIYQYIVVKSEIMMLLDVFWNQNYFIFNVVVYKSKEGLSNSLYFKYVQDMLVCFTGTYR